MSEFRFFSFTDYQYRANDSEFFTLPITLSTKSTPADDNEMSDDLNVPYMVFEILVAIFAVIGNLMVIIVFQRERKLRRRTNYYIVSLAIADFLVGSLGVPFAILASVGLPHDLYTCLFTVSLLVVLCTISIFCLVAVSVDRYWAILYPMAYSRNVRTRTAIIIISMCWLAGTIVGFLPLFGWHVKPEDEMNMRCHFVKVMDYNYLVFLYFATIITPALLMLAFYMHIYRVIVKQVRQIVTMNPMNDNNRRTSNTQLQTTPGRLCHGGTMLRVLGASRKRDVKATQNLSIIVLFFMICWIPLYTINCIKAFCPDCQVPAKLTLFGIILSHLNSAGNPVLYAYHLKDFRLALKNFLLRIVGIKVERPTDPMHRFSLASQHRLHSIDASIRHSLQPRTYIDSPIWLRQQQQTLKSSHSTPKCGVITPCLNNIHHTVAAVASVPTDIGRDIWNIMEASSGAELGDVHYDFPVKRSSNTSSNTPPPQQQQQKQKRRGSSNHHCDSPYSYNNCNYYISPNESECDEVFLPPHLQNISNSSSSSAENIKSNGQLITDLQRSEFIAGKMREKLRSDEMAYDSRVLNNQHALTDSSYSDYDIQQKQSAGHTPPANGGLLRTGQHYRLPSLALADYGHPYKADDTVIDGGVGTCSISTSSQSGISNVGVYVIDNDTNPLSPRRKRKLKKGQRVNTKTNGTTPAVNHKSRSHSCGSGSTTTPTKELREQDALKVADVPNKTHSNGANKVDTGQKLQNCSTNNNNNSSDIIDTTQSLTCRATERLTQPHTIHCLPYDKFSPLRAVSQLIFPPIVKHSSLFQLFQPNVSGVEHATPHNTIAITTHTTSATVATPLTFSTCTSIATTIAKTIDHSNTSISHSPAPSNEVVSSAAVSCISSIKPNKAAANNLSDPKPMPQSKSHPPPSTMDGSTR